jgi:hypothetical protein
MKVLSAVVSSLAVIGFAQAEDDMDYYSEADYTWSGMSLGHHMSNLMMTSVTADAVGDSEPVTTNTLTFNTMYGFMDMSLADVNVWGSRSGSTTKTGFWAAIGFNNDGMMMNESIMLCYVLYATSDVTTAN